MAAIDVRSPLRVCKFGGTSVGTADAVRQALQIVKANPAGLCVVVSAMSGITDLLLGVADAALRGDKGAGSRGALEYSQRYGPLISEIIPSGPVRILLEKILADSCEELHALCDSVCTLRELTPRTRDQIIARGERMLALIFHGALQTANLNVHYLDATELIAVHIRHGLLSPDFEQTSAACAAKIVPQLTRGETFIVPGFIGRSETNEVVTLGRGGSDYSAAILANCTDAVEVTLYKEVDGLMTADPRHVPQARVIPFLHFREAAELAYYGAKILHPRTMIPLADKRIPLNIKNTFKALKPDHVGTRISADLLLEAYPVKALTAAVGQALISIEGKGMMGVPGIAARTFSALAQQNISVSIISQASSESSICFVVPDPEKTIALKSLNDAFQYEISEGLVDRVRADDGIAVLAVVGLGMRGMRGVAGRVFSCLAEAGINIVAIAQGSSELNISVAITELGVKDALNSLHAEFRLDKLQALAERDDRTLDIALCGLGQIGRSLVGQLQKQQEFFKKNLHVTCRTIAVMDRSGLLVEPRGFAAVKMAEIVETKKSGQALVSSTLGGQGLSTLSLSLSKSLYSLPLGRSVFVDLTAEDTAPLILEALREGLHVVLANKKPLAVSIEIFDEMLGVARQKGLQIRYEATVGAGLPVFNTLEKLNESGDPVKKIVGCFSGTLGFLSTGLQNGEKFSKLVREARTKGFTEPDPREDLCGLDVARKALILARTIGHRINLSDIKLAPFVDVKPGVGSVEEFMSKLEEWDEPLRAKCEAAKSNSTCLRFVASIEGGRVEVGLKAFPLSSPLGGLQGTANQLVIQTERYSEANPLVVTGPGAGAEVTAAGVLNDIIAIAQGKDRRPILKF